MPINSLSAVFAGAAVDFRSALRDRKVLFAAVMALSICLTACFCAFTVFADDGSADTAIQDGIKNGTSQLYGIMTAVVIPIAVVFFAWNAFKVFFGGERGMESAKKNMLIAVVVLALVFLAPIIVNQVAGWFSGMSDGAGVFDARYLK